VWDVDPALPALRLDALKLKEVIQNLVSNALKYGGDGRVTVHAFRTADRLHLEVADNGPGIPLDAQERIFDMFERVERADRPWPTGAGLGLYIVKQLVEAMRGAIQVVSEPGSGARFIVNLPLRLEAGRET
jgi:signal transduction histidine kinase